LSMCVEMISGFSLRFLLILVLNYISPKVFKFLTKKLGVESEGEELEKQFAVYKN